jgi:PKD repeat protein
MNKKFTLLFFIIVLLEIQQIFAQPLSLVYPKNDFVTDTSQIRFEWNGIEGATSYHLQIATDNSFTTIVSNHLSITNTFFIDTLTLNEIVWWRVQAIDGASNPFSSPYKLNIINPTFFPGVSIWYSSELGVDTINSNVSSWHDLGGNNNHANQTISSKQPIIVQNALNNKPVLRFDGVNDFMQFSELTNIRSVFIVFKHRTGNAGPLTVLNDNFQTILGHQFNYDFAGFYSTPLFNSLYTSSYLNNGGLFLNGNTASVSSIQKPITYSILSIITSGNLSAQFITNDRNLYGFWDGDYAEILIYNQPLNSANRILIEKYIDNKYAPPVNLGTDIKINYELCNTLLNAGPYFENYLWSSGETTQSILPTHNGIFSVTATDIFGYQSSDTIIINKPIIAINDTSICQNSATLIDTHLGNNYNFIWSTGETTSSITISTAGIYSVTVTDTLGCSLSKTINVFADMFPLTATLGPNTSKCIGDYIYLLNGLSPNLDYLWSDGSTNDSLLIIGANTYSLIVTNANGCIAYDTIIVSISGQVPMTAFSADTVCVGTPTTFTDLSTASPNTIINWYWEFGDGGTSFIQNPTHVFPHDGIFYVSLTSTSDAGCSKTTTLPIIVISTPIVNFVPINGCNGVPINFSDKSICNYGNIDYWLWDFDDPTSAQNSSNLQNPIHTFNAPGSYHVVLTVKNLGECTNSISRTITIKGAPNVDFTYTNTCEGNPVYFTDITSTPTYATIFKWKWNFGDGDTSEIANPLHNFDSANIYNVQLEVKSINGCIVSKTKLVTVNSMPIADFSVNDLCQHSLYQFHDSSSVINSTIIDWNWNFGNGISSTQQNPIISYSDIGEFNVKLTVKSSALCITTTERPIVVYTSPIADFDFTPDWGVAPLEVEFTNLTNIANYFEWNFGDGSPISFIENPINTFNTNGIYNVILISKNQYGCRDTAYHEIKIIPSSIDIALTKLTTTQNNNFLKLSLNLINLGTRNITNLDLFSTLSQSNSIKETWSGILKPGESMVYNFNSEIQLNPTNPPNYICAKALISNLDFDENSSNNEQCITSISEFTVFDFYPNPSDDIINIEFVAPYDDNVGIEIFDSEGKRINILYSVEAKKGLNKIVLTTSFLNSGIYAVKITLNDNSVIKKFMKNN